MGQKSWSPSETTLALNAWWRTQDRWKTKVQAAADLGIPKSTFIDYFHGAEPGDAYRDNLFRATGLPGFAPSRSRSDAVGPSGTSPVEEFDAKLSEVSQTLRLLSDQLGNLHEVFEHLKASSREPARILPFPAKESSDKRVRAVEDLLYQLIAALETFRVSGADRQLLRERLHGPDAGYLLALLNALLDEEKFKSWSAISSYRPLGVKR